MSAKRPHKNLVRLLEAHAALPAERRPLLVVPGYSTPHEAELRASALGSASPADVRMPGWLGAADLEGLYAAARGVRVSVALRGLRAAGARGDAPRRARGVLGPLDACPRWRGTRRCCSTPRTWPPYPARIERLLGDEALRAELAEAGRGAAARFTWEATADATAAVYRRALGAP